MGTLSTGELFKVSRAGNISRISELVLGPRIANQLVQDQVYRDHWKYQVAYYWLLGKRIISSVIVVN
jgi:hypothetical protein